MAIATKTRESGLVVPADAVPDEVPVPNDPNAAAAYWRARYDAMEARTDDPQLIAGAAQFVLSAAVTSNSTGQSFRQTFDNMLVFYKTTRRQRLAKQAPARAKKRK